MQYALNADCRDDPLTLHGKERSFDDKENCDPLADLENTIDGLNSLSEMKIGRIRSLMSIPSSARPIYSTKH